MKKQIAQVLQRYRNIRHEDADAFETTARGSHPIRRNKVYKGADKPYDICLDENTEFADNIAPADLKTNQYRVCDTLKWTAGEGIIERYESALSPQWIYRNMHTVGKGSMAAAQPAFSLRFLIKLMVDDFVTDG